MTESAETRDAAFVVAGCARHPEAPRIGPHHPGCSECAKWCYKHDPPFARVRHPGKRGWRCPQCERDGALRRYYDAVSTPEGRDQDNARRRIVERSRREDPEYRERNNSRTRDLNARVKSEALDVYGRVCYCCGEGLVDMLTLDHVDQDGSEHRRDERIAAGLRTYLWARRNGWPPIFRTACFNCNMSAYRNGGTCAHGSTPSRG